MHLRFDWHLRSTCLLGAACTVLAACDLTQLDAIAQPSEGPAPSVQNEPDASDGAIAVDALPSEEGGPSSSACASDIMAVREWTFDSTVEDWISSPDTGVQATLRWNGTLGDPSPGALEADITPSPSDAGAISGAWVAYDMPSPTDLSKRTLSAWVMLESGVPPHLKTLVQTGSQYVWADNGTVFLTPNLWTCVSIDISTPSYIQPDYDPTQVVRVGFEMLGTTPFVMLIDDVRYY